MEKEKRDPLTKELHMLATPLEMIITRKGIGFIYRIPQKKAGNVPKVMKILDELETPVAFVMGATTPNKGILVFAGNINLENVYRPFAYKPRLSEK